MEPLILGTGTWFGALGYPVRALRARKIIGKGGYVSLTIDGPVAELPAPKPWWSAKRTSSIAVSRVRDLVDQIARDPKIQGLVIELRSLRGGSAVTTSLRDALLRLRASGKPLIVYLPMGAGSREMLIAATATR